MKAVLTILAVCCLASAGLADDNSTNRIFALMDEWATNHQTFHLSIDMKQGESDVVTEVYSVGRPLGGVKGFAIINSKAPQSYSYMMKTLEDGTIVALFPTLHKFVILQTASQINDAMSNLGITGGLSQSINSMSKISKSETVKSDENGARITFDLDTEMLMKKKVVPPLTPEIQIEIDVTPDGKPLKVIQTIENQPPGESVLSYQTFEASAVTNAILSMESETANTEKTDLSLDDCIAQLMLKH